jgi:aspartyl-tRNA(Asn)/glutamyl-tRNA(Gln) amidotransferase subunit A
LLLELSELTIHKAHDLLAGRQVSSVELTSAVLSRIAAVDEQIKAYLHVDGASALASAAAADQRRAAGEDHSLLGVPLAVKDVIVTKGMPTTCGSRILQGFVPPYDAMVVSKLRDAGAVILGKTNTDEFAMGSTTENSSYFTTHNPWNLSRVPGGSSGGSAAATAADECIGSLGSDTGGSIRQPAALCGVVGLKPTYGRVSRYGLVAFASSLDQIGPICKDVTDCAILFQSVAGHDPRDSTSVDLPVPDCLAQLEAGVKGMRLGVPKEYFVQGMQPEVEQAVRQALVVLQELGAEIVEVSMPHTDYCLSVYYLLAPAEASANLARFDGIRYGYSAPDASDLWDGYRTTRAEGFGAEVKRRIMLGTYALSAGYYDAYYLKAQKVRTLIKQDYDIALEQCDALVAPTTPTTAFGIGEKVNDPLQMYLSDIFTLSLNLAGVCGMSIPCGFAGGLPIGLQIMGDSFAESTILRVARAYERATDWHLARPPL